AAARARPGARYGTGARPTVARWSWRCWALLADLLGVARHPGRGALPGWEGPGLVVPVDRDGIAILTASRGGRRRALGGRRIHRRDTDGDVGRLTRLGHGPRIGRGNV